MARIVVVDDEPDLVALIKKMIPTEYEAEGFTDSIRALESIQLRPADILITDLMMPDMDGFWLIAKARRTVPNLQVIVISGFVDRNDPLVQRVITPYTTSFLGKPFTREEFLETLASVAPVEAPEAGGSKPGPAGSSPSTRGPGNS